MPIDVDSLFHPRQTRIARRMAHLSIDSGAIGRPQLRAHRLTTAARTLARRGWASKRLHAAAHVHLNREAMWRWQQTCSEQTALFVLQLLTGHGWDANRWQVVDAWVQLGSQPLRRTPPPNGEAWLLQFGSAHFAVAYGGMWFQSRFSSHRRATHASAVVLDPATPLANMAGGGPSLASAEVEVTRIRTNPTVEREYWG